MNTFTNVIAKSMLAILVGLLFTFIIAGVLCHMRKDNVLHEEIYNTGDTISIKRQWVPLLNDSGEVENRHLYLERVLPDTHWYVKEIMITGPEYEHNALDTMPLSRVYELLYPYN